MRGSQRMLHLFLHSQTVRLSAPWHSLPQRLPRCGMCCCIMILKHVFPSRPADITRSPDPPQILPRPTTHRPQLELKSSPHPSRIHPRAPTPHRPPIGRHITPKHPHRSVLHRPLTIFIWMVRGTDTRRCSTSVIIVPPPRVAQI